VTSFNIAVTSVVGFVFFLVFCAMLWRNRIVPALLAMAVACVFGGVIYNILMLRHIFINSPQYSIEVLQSFGVIRVYDLPFVLALALGVAAGLLYLRRFRKKEEAEEEQPVQAGQQPAPAAVT
jgi:hypothetical protein